MALSLRALRQPQESNAAYRDAATAAPRDAAIQTAWGELFLERFDKANGGAPDSPPDPAPKRRPRQPK